MYVWLTYCLLAQGRSQLVLSQNPVIVVEPAEDAQGEVGEFNLSLRNLGLSKVQDIRIFEDYFVGMTLKGGPIRLTRFGMFSVKPNSTISKLDPDESADFRITFKAIQDEMKAFYNSDAKGHRMMIARLTLKYRRVRDGKEFSKSKAYIIAGHGDYLLDHDERGMTFPGGPSFSEIKQVLGVSD